MGDAMRTGERHRTGAESAPATWRAAPQLDMFVAMVQHMTSCSWASGMRMLAFRGCQSLATACGRRRRVHSGPNSPSLAHSRRPLHNTSRPRARWPRRPRETCAPTGTPSSGVAQPSAHYQAIVRRIAANGPRLQRCRNSLQLSLASLCALGNLTAPVSRALCQRQAKFNVQSVRSQMSHRRAPKACGVSAARPQRPAPPSRCRRWA